MKAVILKSTSKVVYRQEPEFEEGKGILNAKALYGYSEEELIEVEVSQDVIDSIENNKTKNTIKEDLIKEEMNLILRDQAIGSLKNKGII